MAQIRARFRFASDLHRFLKPAFRVPEFDHTVGATDTVKHLIESFGVPHTEIGEVLADGQPVSLSDQLQDGATVDIHPLPQRIREIELR